MSQIARLFALAFVAACSASNGAAIPDSTKGGSTTPPPVAVDRRDWTRFNVDESRSGIFAATTGITAATLPTMQRQQVTLDGTVDASPIYLHGVSVGGATHDVFFVTTSYGKTIAIDASSGATLWEFTPPGYSQWAATSRITNARSEVPPRG